MSAEKINVGLFLVEVQQSIVAIGTFCDDLDTLTIASEPARDKLAELLGKSIAVSDAFGELVATQQETLRMLEAAYRQLGMWTDDNKRIQRALNALACVGGVE
jgi:hypothetical protein